MQVDRRGEGGVEITSAGIRLQGTRCEAWVSVESAKAVLVDVAVIQW